MIMMIEYAPLIHTRTLHCDYIPGFIVRPKDFDDTDVRWANKCVLTATADLSGTSSERWLFIKTMKWTIVGVVSVIKKLAEKCPTLANTSQKFFFDDKKRLIPAFIGLAFKSDCSHSLIIPAYDFLLELFMNHMNGIWEYNSVKTELCDFASCVNLPNIGNVNAFSYHNSTVTVRGTVRGVSLYESSANSDISLLRDLMNNQPPHFRGLCTGLLSVGSVKKALNNNDSFSHVTTTANVIEQMKKQYAVNLPVQEVHEELDDIHNYEQEAVANLETKKNQTRVSLPITLLLLILLFLAMVIVLLLILGAGRRSIAALIQSNLAGMDYLAASYHNG